LYRSPSRRRSLGWIPGLERGGFHEQLVRDHGFWWGYTWVKIRLHTAGLVERAKRRGGHRCKRERKAFEGA
jgi:hypothetical protein